jgi:hypothetical protein
LRSKADALLRGLAGRKLTGQIKKLMKSSNISVYPVQNPVDLDLLHGTKIPVNWKYLARMNEHARDRVIAFGYLLGFFKDKLDIAEGILH